MVNIVLIGARRSLLILTSGDVTVANSLSRRGADV